MDVEQLVQKYVDRYGGLVTEFQDSENPTQQDFEELIERLGHRASLPIWHDDVDGFVSDITDGDFIREASPIVQGELTDMIIDVASGWARRQAVTNETPAEELQQFDVGVLIHRFERRITRMQKRNRIGERYNDLMTVRDALKGEVSPAEGISAAEGRNGEIWSDARELLASLF